MSAQSSAPSSFKSRKERLGQESLRVGVDTFSCFKSRKERLGPEPGKKVQESAGEFQIPEGTFGTSQRFA